MPRKEITRCQQLMPTDELLDLIYRNINAAATRASTYPEKQPPGLSELGMAVKLLADLVDREQAAGKETSPPESIEWRVMLDDGRHGAEVAQELDTEHRAREWARAEAAEYPHYTVTVQRREVGAWETVE